MSSCSSMPVLYQIQNLRTNISSSMNNIVELYLHVNVLSPLPLPSYSRYPHLACEILTADVFSIIESLATTDKFLPMLWTFLYEEAPLNPLIGRYGLSLPPSFPPSLPPSLPPLSLSPSLTCAYLLLSFFSFNSKILGMLLGQRTTIFLEYIQKIEDFLNLFLKHLGTSAIMDLLLQMIAAPEGDQGRQDVATVIQYLFLISIILLF